MFSCMCYEFCHCFPFPCILMSHMLKFENLLTGKVDDAGRYKLELKLLNIMNANFTSTNQYHLFL